MARNPGSKIGLFQNARGTARATDRSGRQGGATTTTAVRTGQVVNRGPGIALRTGGTRTGVTGGRSGH